MVMYHIACMMHLQHTNRKKATPSDWACLQTPRRMTRRAIVVKRLRRMLVAIDLLLLIFNLATTTHISATKVGQAILKFAL